MLSVIPLLNVSGLVDMNMESDSNIDLVRKGLEESAKVKLSMVDIGLHKVIVEMALVCVKALESGRKLIIAGNGGSAADAQHIAAELIGRYRKDRMAISAIALTTDTSAITAIANDMGYEAVFARQLEAIGKSGDIFWAISTSGDSKNLVAALNKANKMGITTICFLGKDGGAMKGLGGISLVIPTKDTPRIQEAHITVGHLICDIIEQQLDI
ncbi:MAG TPA: D-sedoheptulose 7-phosphate isomerase [Nitrospinota bacterium]|nr:D-sedoheptulose 7-phosphate isomerase [Nitrospinota bacterium]|tara:strand:- start:304727 stop:305365 length:639 start_codon:yes stop_codon:yes gene_type:complete